MNQQQAVMKVCENPLLCQVVEKETFVFWRIVDDAIRHPEGVSRWRHYEALKRQTQRIVGWHAQHEELATSRHYEAMIGLIDDMLPAGSVNDRPDLQTYGDVQERAHNGFVPIGVLVNEFMQDIEQRRRQQQEESDAS